jgi:uncharacterized protein YktA (UPF0223 family)
MTTETAEKVVVTTEEMDDAVKYLKKLEAAYKIKKDEAEQAHGFYEDQKQLVISMLESIGKTVYIAEGVARVKVTTEMSYQTPKTIEEKEAFFKWLAENEGEEVMMTYRTVNSQALNSLLNELEERYAREGKVLQADGIGQPIARTKLSVTKA